MTEVVKTETDLEQEDFIISISNLIHEYAKKHDLADSFVVAANRDTGELSITIRIEKQ